MHVMQSPTSARAHGVQPCRSQTHYITAQTYLADLTLTETALMVDTFFRQIQEQFPGLDPLTHYETWNVSEKELFFVLGQGLFPIKCYNSNFEPGDWREVFHSDFICQAFDDVWIPKVCTLSSKKWHIPGVYTLFDIEAYLLRYYDPTQGFFQFLFERARESGKFCTFFRFNDPRPLPHSTPLATLMADSTITSDTPLRCVLWPKWQNQIRAWPQKSCQTKSITNSGPETQVPQSESLEEVAADTHCEAAMLVDSHSDPIKPSSLVRHRHAFSTAVNSAGLIA